MKNIWLWWSSGKDSAWALLRLGRHQRSVTRLVTTVNESFDRVAMHAVRRDLLRRQAERAGLELHILPIPHPCSNAQYEARVSELLEEASDDGVEAMAFGDLFLEDVRRYRESLLQGSGIEALFPLWGEDTAALSGEMIAGGLEAVVTCIDPKRLPRELAGRRYDDRFLADLPEGVDPCGENGEFHTFATGGPMFTHSIEVRRGEVVEREGFVFADFVER